MSTFVATSVRSRRAREETVESSARTRFNVLTRRPHSCLETRDRGLLAAPGVAVLIGAEPGRDPGQVGDELDRYRALVDFEVEGDLESVVDSLEPSR